MKILIIGGGLRGCAAARAASRLGAQVTLLESRQILGHEITAAGQEWLASGKSEITLMPGALAKSLLAEQLELGTNVLLNAQAGGILVGGGRAAGALIADPFGTQLCEADLVIDTEGGLLTDMPAGEAEIRYAFVLTGMNPMFRPEIPMPAEFGLKDNILHMHLSCRPNCAVAELRFLRKIDAASAGNPNRVLPAAQRLAADVFGWLHENHEAFAEAGMHNLLHNEVRIFGVQHTPLCRIEGYHPLKTVLSEPMSRVSLTNMADDITAEIAELMRTAQPAAAPESIVTRDGEISLSACTLFDDPAVAFRSGPVLRAVKLPDNAIAVRETVPVIVAGAGTAGLPALDALRESGVTAAAVELCGITGGTHNPGMVSGYYHGHKGGRNAADGTAVSSISKQYHVPVSGARMLQNSIALSSMEEHFYFNTVICGAARDGRQVKNLLCCDGSGLFRLAADVIIDATGDAVAAYLAGAEYMLGDSRDGNVQTYSLWGENLWRSSSFLENRYHGDHDVIDMDSYEDCLRGMYLAQHDNSDIRYSPLLTVRESRRVIGDYVLNMDDIWDETVFDDTICVAMTTFDTHGKGSALYCDMALTSLGGKELRARIPYRCYTVRDFDNMLVTAKAYSATREGNSIGRMNPDLRHAGYAVGLAAAQAVKNGTSLRSIDLTPIQEELRRQEILPEWTFEPMETHTAAELIQMAEEGNTEALMKIMRNADESTLALLSQRWQENPTGNAVLWLSAWHELPGAVDAAADRLIAILKKSAENPEGKINEYASARILLGTLVHASQVDSEKLAEIVSMSCTGGDISYPPTHRYYKKIYGYERVDGWKVPHFQYLYMLAQAVERHADAKLRVPMESLLGRQYVSGYAMHNGEAPDAPFISHSITPYFCAMLELRLAAAAARCGSADALKTVQAYAEEDRSLFRKFASAELAEIGTAGAVCPCTAEPVLR